MEPLPEAYLAACKHRFGTANPDRMREPVWEWMIRQDHIPNSARAALGLPPDYGVYSEPKNPDWCFLRMGAAVVELPDGRRLTIAGEHEDYYDPHFCIYNDLIVQRGEEVEIYGYPRDVFPPTDFHTATLVGGAIWIVGSLGYHAERGSETQVFVLDSDSYVIRRALPTGLSPGWVNHHRAKLLDDGLTIEISGGEILHRLNGANRWRKNTDVFHLNTRDLTWTKTTDTSAWRQYRIDYEQDYSGSISATDEGWYTGEVFRNLGDRFDVSPEPEESEESSGTKVYTVWIGDTPIRIEDLYGEFSLIIEGPLSASDTQTLLDRISAILESNKRHVTEISER